MSSTRYPICIRTFFENIFYYTEYFFLVWKLPLTMRILTQILICMFYFSNVLFLLYYKSWSFCSTTNLFTYFHQSSTFKASYNIDKPLTCIMSCLKNFLPLRYFFSFWKHWQLLGIRSREYNKFSTAQRF